MMDEKPTSELIQDVRAEKKIIRFPKHHDADPLTEDALALRFSERHENDLRYVAARAQWFKWDGVRWRPEPTHLAFDLARDSCRTDAETYGNGRPLAVTAQMVAAVERMAKADRRQAATLEQFDADGWLINAATEDDMSTAQAFDLRNGTARPPSPGDFITKKTACAAAAPGTPHPLWTMFLDKITAGNVELQKFLQRYIGYCCTGATDEHVFVFAYGTGANGKSTFINTVLKILGDYGTVADVGTFIASNYERHPTDMAKLHGARLVVAQETEKGRRWDEAKIKTMTGGDKMAARFMRQDFFDFIPTFKLFITGNHKPRLENVDEAMRRRLLLVPFVVQIPPEERDPDLPEKLKSEWPAILRWCLDGCGEWRRIGLAPPDLVTEATKSYFDDQDVLSEWLEDCTADGGPFAFTASTQLYASWKQWCDERGMEPGSVKALSDGLTDRGYIPKRTKRGRGFHSLVLKQPDSEG
jgi:putative DNA primase/helicase